jgi:hypothetical protein
MGFFVGNDGGELAGGEVEVAISSRVGRRATTANFDSMASGVVDIM